MLVPDQAKKKFSVEDELMDLMRPKRSTGEFTPSPKNGTVQFHHAIDEINEGKFFQQFFFSIMKAPCWQYLYNVYCFTDTLKNGNLSGTIEVKKLDILNKEKLSRRTYVSPDKNSSNPLHIEYNKPKLFQYMSDNKIDTTVHTNDKYKFYDGIQLLSGNVTQQQKNRDLSKLIANELKGGVEVIGDKNAAIMSNVTFTPENDTLTAMTFIAGNLLNKLWNMERDSSESIETEVLKHEKIADLLEIFKEPLTLRQESFLRNALQQLSIAIDKSKDIKKVSLCDNVEKVKSISRSNYKGSIENNDSEEHSTSTTEKHNAKSTKAEAITKMNNVIDLIKKFENVQMRANYLKQTRENKVKSKNISTNVTEKPLDLFGGILEKITKLIIPDERSKNIISNIKSQNIYSNANAFEKQFKEIFNIDIRNLTMSTKDKIVLDYLQHVDSNPNCLLNHKNDNSKIRVKSNIEGILLNLSEFFKIKSLGELVQLVSSPTQTAVKKLQNIRTLEKSKQVTETHKNVDEIPKNNTKTLSNTKEKLKAHLKSILEDVMEIQVDKGLAKGKSAINITDILPCIYNILNTNDDIKHNEVDKPKSIEKVSVIFQNLKKDLKYTQKSRRTNTVFERPKSATVWDRLIKTLNDKYKLNSRRNLNSLNRPNMYEELRKMMDETESGSNTYKSVALLHDVPAADKLTLLKTFYMDVKKYTDVLEHIKVSLKAGKVPRTKFNEITEYIDNVKNNINLNKKVVRNMNREKQNKDFSENQYSKQRNTFKANVIPKKSVRVNEVTSAYKSNTKITRDQIINQLIKNRLKLYINIKEASRVDITEDINYNIAKKILFYLERGNYVIARELYKIFVSKHEANKMNDRTIGKFLM